MAAKSCVLLFVFVCASLGVKGGDASAALLAKPALVPFTQNEGSVLVHVDPDLLQQCLRRDPHLAIADESGLVSVTADLNYLKESHIDRFGLKWLHVSTDLKKMPLGATAVKVTTCGVSVITKVNCSLHAR